MEFLRKVPDWSAFKSLGSSKVIKSSYWWLFLVPVLAKIMESAGDTFELTLFDSTFILTLSLPFSWALFYFSAVSFSLASIIYLTMCPQGIDKYDNFEDWKKSGKDSTSLISSFFFHYRNDKRMAPFQISDDEKDHFLSHHLKFNGERDKINKQRSGTPLVLIRAGIPQDNLKETYYYICGTVDRSRVTSRIVMSTFYGIGFLLFSVVLIQNFIFVCKHL